MGIGTADIPFFRLAVDSWRGRIRLVGQRKSIMSKAKKNSKAVIERIRASRPASVIVTYDLVVLHN